MQLGFERIEARSINPGFGSADNTFWV